MKKLDKVCSKAYSYLKDNNDEGKKSKRYKKVYCKKKT